MNELDEEKKKSNVTSEQDEKEMDKSLQDDNMAECDNDVVMVEISDEEVEKPEKCDEEVGKNPKCDDENLKKYDDAIQAAIQKGLDGKLSSKEQSSPKRSKSFKTPNKEGTSGELSKSSSPLPKSASKLSKGQKTIFDMMKKIPRKLDVSVEVRAQKRSSSGTTGGVPEKTIKVDTTIAKVINYEQFTKEETENSTNPVTVGDKEELKLEEHGLVIIKDEPVNKNVRMKSKRIEAKNIEEEEKKKKETPTPKSPGTVKKMEERKKQQLEKRKSIKLQKEQERKEKEEQRKQKKIEEEQRKKQKKLEEEERKKQKKLEEEERKKQKKLEEEQERKLKLEMKKKMQEEKEEGKRKEKEKKEAERQRKEAERLKKEQERQKAFEEKVKAIEEAKRLKEKRALAFKSFFLKSAKPTTQPCDANTESIGQFHAFQVKEGMYLAPIVRGKWSDDQKTSLDDALKTQESKFRDVTQWITVAASREHSEATIPKLGSKQLKLQDDDNSDLSNSRAKLMQFHENYRPPYYGTWRKKSGLISARNPFKQDKEQLDYDFESDDEWEEPVDGEDIVNSEGEEDATENATENDDDEDEDGFFVPHGYLSNDEGINDEDSDTECKEDVSDQRLKAKQLEFESKWKQKLKVLNPITIGCLYDDGDPNLIKKYNDMFLGYEWRFLCERPINLEVVEPKKEQPTKTKPVKTVKASKVVPKEAMPDLVRLCHGNPYALKRIVKEFQKYWELKTNDSLPRGGGPLEKDETPYCAPKPTMPTEAKQQTATNAATSSKATGVVIAATKRSPRSENKIAKSQLVKKIKEIAVYGRKENLSRQCWFVIDSIFEEYGLDRQSFPIPCRWGFVTPVPEVRVDILPPVTPPLPPTTADLTTTPQNITVSSNAVSAKIRPVTTEISKAPPDKNESVVATTAQENAPISNPISKYISKTNPVELLENSHKKALKIRRVALTTVPLTTTPKPLPETPEVNEVETQHGFGFSQPSKAAFKSLFKLVNSPKKSTNITSTVTPPNPETNQDENKEERKVTTQTIDLT